MTKSDPMLTRVHIGTHDPDNRRFRQEGRTTQPTRDRPRLRPSPGVRPLRGGGSFGRSPNTLKSYARALALWWEFLTVYGLAWDRVTVEDFGRFFGWLPTGDAPVLVSIERRSARFSEGTIALRLQAVCSLYRYQHFQRRRGRLAAL